MTEEEANELIAEVGVEVEGAIAQWRLQGADNRGAGIHQIFTRETVLGIGEDGVIANEANWTGVVGLSGTKPWTLVIEENGDERAIPNAAHYPRYDGTFLRPDLKLDFVQFIDESDNVSMRIFISDPWGTIGGQNCAAVTNTELPYGGRPYLEIPNDGNQYGIFKSAFCSRLVTFPSVDNEMPTPDVLSDNKFEYALYVRSTSSDWMPDAPSYGFIETVGLTDLYEGTLTKLVSSTTCMGFYEVNIAPVGEPVVENLCFIVAEQNNYFNPPVFGWSDADTDEYQFKGFDTFNSWPYFDRLAFLTNPKGLLTGGREISPSELNFQACPTPPP